MSKSGTERREGHGEEDSNRTVIQKSCRKTSGWGSGQRKGEDTCTSRVEDQAAYDALTRERVQHE